MLVDLRSEDWTSSAAISMNIKMYSPPAPLPDSEVTTCKIQSGHFDGRPGTSLSASVVIYCEIMVRRRCCVNVVRRWQASLEGLIEGRTATKSLRRVTLFLPDATERPAMSSRVFRKLITCSSGKVSLRWFQAAANGENKNTHQSRAIFT